MKLIKLGTLKDPHNPHSLAEFSIGEEYEGDAGTEPTVGERFIFWVAGGGYISTSPVKCVYRPHTENDKLVLPSDFPEPLLLDSSLISKDDVLIATLNSVWALKHA